MIRRLGGDRAGEIRVSRFLRNPHVSEAEMVATAALRTAERCAGRHVLAIQDTTAVRADPAGGGGLYLHATIAVDAVAGDILGPIDMRYCERTAGKRQHRTARGFDVKESARWLVGAERAAETCAGAARITVVADRESDIYELFARRPASVGLIIRATQDRALGDGGRLFATADTLPEAGRMTVDLPAAPGRRARRMTLALRWTQTEIRRPTRRSAARDGVLPETTPITIVDAREVDPPAGETPAHWRLLTTDAVGDVSDARRVVATYRRRWAIEQVFRTMKTKGFDVEGLRIEEDAPRRKLVIATFIAAIIVQQLVHARDGAGNRPFDDAFDPDDGTALQALCRQLEGTTKRQKNPHPPNSLAFAAWVCARLGGWTGYYGKPGPIVMLRGWLQFCAIKHGWTLAHHNV